jgi:translation initiation factor 2B subunit (eIF-2B alpha/beta/delta family)
VISFRKLPEDIRTWERDRVNGAAFLARQAVTLAAANTNAGRENTHNSQSSFDQPSISHSIAMLRPSMVPIVNVMNEFDRRIQTDPDSDRVGENLRQSLDEEIGKCVDLGFETIMRYYKQWKLNSPSATVFAIGTFSRSSTMKKILERLQEESNEVKVLCSQSTPGDEGELMAADIPGAKWISDQEFRQYIEQGKIELVVVGADCILQEGKGIVNKIGTASLATCCRQKNIPLICCADRWKVWEDVYPPGLEDIFESFIPDKLEHVLVPDCNSKAG